jgi:exonuclease SbcC
LKIANRYLGQFTDRFILTCSPGSLVILVKDKFMGTPPQSTSILSGGESFMVSLSLALALSQLSASSNSVDTLFIDEGFGTLDPEYLQSVMTTLERLHQMGGRRVGIISHVATLAQTIPTQIQVREIDPTKSKIEVVQL